MSFALPGNGVKLPVNARASLPVPPGPRKEFEPEDSTNNGVVPDETNG